MMLPVRPDGFDGIQFGRVGGKVFLHDPPVQPGDVVLNQAAPVGGKPVPHQQERLGDVAD